MTRRDAAGLAALAAASVAFAVGVLQQRADQRLSLVAYDFYGQFYPFFLHAWRSLWTGGGLLWNPYQDCGQPFFGNSQTGVLNPLNLIFALLPREAALLASIVVNLTIAGVGMYLLCRSLRLLPAAALSGALAFQLSQSALNLAAWSPTHIAPFAWLPVALWRSERLIQQPTLRRALLLAAVLAIQLLPGFPQTVFFTYQLIALRAVWALLFAQSAAPRRLPLLLGLGLALPLLLNAVQLLPAIEVARESVRAAPLGVERLGPGFSWGALRQQAAAWAVTPGNALILLLALYGAAAARQTRRAADGAFYALVAILYFLLSLGPGSLLYDAYALLPLGSTFREPSRLQWVTSFALAALVGLAAHALLAPGSAAEPAGGVATVPSWRTRLPLLLIGAALAASVVARAGPSWAGAALIVALVALFLAPLPPRFALLLPVALPALIAVDALALGRPPLFGLRPGDVYESHADVFDLVRARMTPQDRILIVAAQPALGLMPKSATLFALPNVHDYDPLAAQRYAEYFTFLRTGHPMRDYEDWYWLFGKLLPASLRRPLFDQTAARYLIVAEPLDQTARALRGGVRLLHEGNGVRVYENEQALPRARFVPRVTVTADAEVLPTLARQEGATRDAVLVAASDAPALRGGAGAGSGTVQFVSDEPERIVLRVSATAPGFLFLADEYFPGWQATVNEQAAPIVRANHTFRVVEVPAGDSEVQFVYRPRSLHIGAAVSALAILSFGLLWWRGRSER